MIPNPYEVDVISDGRDYMECPYCGFKGIGWVSNLTNGEIVAECDICGKSSGQNDIWSLV